MNATPCGARPVTGDLWCVRPAGHDGLHRNAPCGARPVTGDLTCVRPAGHDGLHRNHQCIGYRSREDVAAADESADELAANRRADPDLAGILTALFPDSPPPDLATAVEWQTDRLNTIGRMSAAYGREKARAERAEASATDWREKHDAAAEYVDLLEQRLNRGLAILEGRNPDAGNDLVDDS